MSQGSGAGAKVPRGRRALALTALLAAFAASLLLDAAGPEPIARSARADTSAERPIVPPGYHHIVRSWHRRDSGARAPVDAKGRPMLVLHAMYLKERVALPVETDRGGFAPADIARASHVLREPGTQREHPVDPRTLGLLYRIQRRFDAPEIRVLSGYRAPKGDKGRTSNHGRGRAVDFVVPGAEDEEVARFARQFGFAGVGIYPVSSFVHVDIRPRSYFWRDKSGPGHKNRERGILPDLARRADESAVARGEGPPPLYVPPGGSPGAPPAAVDEDEDED